jgi:hypothetical protein
MRAMDRPTRRMKMNSNGRTVVHLQVEDGKMRFVPVDAMMDKGIDLTDNLQIIWNAKRDDLSINASDGSCVMHFEIHDGRLECVYFDGNYVETQY